MGSGSLGDLAEVDAARQRSLRARGVVDAVIQQQVHEVRGCSLPTRPWRLSHQAAPSPSTSRTRRSGRASARPRATQPAHPSSHDIELVVSVSQGIQCPARVAGCRDDQIARFRRALHDTQHLVGVVRRGVRDSRDTASSGGRLPGCRQQRRLATVPCGKTKAYGVPTARSAAGRAPRTPDRTLGRREWLPRDPISSRSRGVMAPISSCCGSSRGPPAVLAR